MRSTADPLRHIIWDWNGTLLNDKGLCIHSINRLLAERNLPVIDEDTYHRIFRFPVREYYELAGFDFSKEPFEIPAMEFIRHYDEGRLKCELQEGAREVLQFFRDLGCRQYLLSASETGVLLDMTRHFGISGFFEKIQGLDNHYAHSKVDLGRDLIESLELDPDTVLLIGDTCHDEEVARAMGVKSVLITSGHYPEWRLRDCSSRLLNTLSEIPGLFISNPDPS